MAASGSFAVDDRVGGLASISYHISGDLEVKFGYSEFDKPTFYSAPLPASLDSFSFPEDKGYPDVFTIVNNGENSVTITDMAFYYSCNQQDEHVPVGDGVITREIVDNEVKYYEHDLIDTTRKMEVDLSSYQIKIGTSSSDLVTYDPYNYASYSGVGSLDFDFANVENPGDKRFVLTLSGDYGSEDIYIDSNVTNSSKAQIFIKSTAGAKIRNVTFKGGNGVLLFSGEKLTFNNGSLDTEAYYTVFKGQADFDGSGRANTAIYQRNGQLTFENKVTIDDYNRGIYVKPGQYMTLENRDVVIESTGDVSVGNCNYAMWSNNTNDHNNYVGTLIIRGKLYVYGSRRGIQDFHVNVGDDAHAANLIIDVSKNGTSSGDPSVGILSTTKVHRLQFNNGKAAIISSDSSSTPSWSGSECSGIKVNGGFDANDYSKYHWADSFEFGMGNIRYAFDNSDGNTKFDFAQTNIGKKNFWTYNVGDKAWYVEDAYKPQRNDISKDDFNTKFGTSL